MKHGKLPDYKEKQRLIYSAQTPEEILINYGDSFFSAERYDDAIDFYEKANYKRGLQKIGDLAIEEGDLFLYKRVYRFLGEKQISYEIANKIGSKALELEKYSFAKKAFEIAGNQEMLNKLTLDVEGEGLGKA
ncbi:MAG: hypothetical protein A2149_07620 [Candidatus Schekmanbacteria bacterium RBG_16_38_11]|uniref:Uncharacterized protein n=2 Tax=Candidatus Schekmaniibacteriota TaxID=1817811 RepID=A0A1F7RCT1_9BACT|nr:MAG: hypothetical protein A2042_03055 [Candidatus Schekmanbacteria bacterium GWA2_38_11]OGL46888.1 MAG: hypothetical protein A2149_07620 [Candidatus Schekmanbacteria bacterium RBG_16_38_11]